MRKRFLPLLVVFGFLLGIHNGHIGMRILKRCNITSGLIQHQIYLLLALHLLVIELNLIG